METVTYTLVTDGTSDRALLPIVTWALAQLYGESEPVEISAQYADLAWVTPRPRGLAERLNRALEEYPCDIMVVHRDSEGAPWEERLVEVRSAARRASVKSYVPLIPVRMMEAWLLLDDKAIRRAADNPNGRAHLPKLPLDRIERLVDAKETLRQRLLAASAKQGRSRSRFERDLAWRIQRVVEFMDEFSSLRQLPSFVRFEADLKRAILHTGTNF